MGKIESCTTGETNTSGNKDICDTGREVRSLSTGGMDGKGREVDASLSSNLGAHLGVRNTEL